MKTRKTKQNKTKQQTSPTQHKPKAQQNPTQHKLEFSKRKIRYNCTSKKKQKKWKKEEFGHVETVTYF